MKTLSQRHQNTPARGATTIAREDLLPYLGRSPIYRGTRACPYHARQTRHATPRHTSHVAKTVRERAYHISLFPTCSTTSRITDSVIAASAPSAMPSASVI